MSVCPNCKKSLSCGCQKRKASDGKAVCSNCITTYESKIKTVSNAIYQKRQNDINPKVDINTPDLPAGWKEWLKNLGNK